MTWNGVWLEHAPRIRHLTLWERWNNKLEHVAIPAILPCMMGAVMAGLYAGPAFGV